MSNRLFWLDPEKLEASSRGLHIWRDGRDQGEELFLLLPITLAPDGSPLVDGMSAIDFESGGNVAAGWFDEIRRTLRREK